jgi:PAS domain S-box-containing protein
MVTNKGNCLLIGNPSSNEAGIVKLLRDTVKIEVDCRHVTTPGDIEAALNEHQWDIILFDSVMPGSNPSNVIQQIQRLQPQAPLIVLSEVATLQDAVDMMRQGARGVVDMADHSRLVDMIRQELETSRTARASATPSSWAQNSRQPQQKSLKDILDTVQDAIFSLSLPDRQLIYANESFESVFGYPLQRILDDAEFFKQIVHPDDLEEALTAMQTCLHEGFAELEHRIVLPDGQVRWLHRQAWVLFDEQGYPMQVNDSARDITKRKQVEAALSASEERYRSLVESSDGVIALFDDAGQVLYVNPAAALSLGQPAEHLVGKTMHDLFPPEYADRQLKTIQKVYRTGVRQIDESPTTVQEGLRWYHTSTQPVRDESGAVYAVLVNSVDVTEKKRTERALKDSEERLRSILENMDDVVWSADLTDFGITYLNPAAETIYGRSAADFYGNDALWSELIHPEDAHRATQMHNELLEKGFRDAEYRIVRPDGEIRWLWDRAWVVRNDDGNPIRIDGIAADITEEKQSEEALRTSEERYRSLIESSEAAISLVDETGKIWFVNGVAARALNMPPEAVTGKSVTDLFPPETAKNQLDLVQRTIRSGTGQVAVRPIRLPGETRWYRTSAQPVHDASGAVIAAMVNASDITTLKQAEDALRASEEKYRTLIESSDSIISTVDEAGNLQFINQAGAQIIHVQDDDTYIGKNLKDFFPPELSDYQINTIQTVIRTGTGQVLEEMVAVNDEKRWYRISIQPVRDSSGKVTTALINSSDITHLKQAESTLKSMNEELEQRVAERTAELQRTRDRIEAIFNHSGDGILLLDVKHEIQQANLAFDTMFDMAEDSYFRAPFSSYFHPDNASSIQTTLSDVTADHQLRRVEARAKRSDGTYFDVELSVAPVNLTENAVENIVCIVRDISERKQAEIERQNHLAEIEDLYNNAPAGYHSLNPAGVILQINDTELDWLGYTREEVVGKLRFVELLTPASQSTFRQKFPLLQKHGQVNDIEFEMMCKDGTSIWVMGSATIVRDENGKFARSRATLYNTTELKRAQQTLAEERSLLRTVIDSLPSYVYVKDREHRLNLCNKAYAQAQGYAAPADLYGKTDSDLYSPEDAAKFQTQDKQVCKTGVSLDNLQNELTIANGKRIWTLTSKVPLRNLQGEITGVLCVTHDVTRIKESEEALRASEQRLRESENMLQMVLDTIPVRVFWKDTDLVYLGCNRLFAEDAGLADSRDIIGKTDADLPWLDEQADAYRSDDKAVIERGTPKPNYEESLTTGEGKQVVLETSKFPLRNAEGNIVGILGTFVDITERKRAEEQLQYLASLQAFMHDAVVSYDMNFHIQSWNRAAERMTGWTADEVIGHHRDEIIKVEMIHETFESVVKHMRDAGYWSGESLTYHRDGTPISTWSSIGLSRNEGGRPTGIIAVLHDISDRKQTELALKQSEEQYRMLAENVKDVIVKMDSQANVTFATPSVLEMLGYTPEEAVTMSGFDILHPDDIDRVRRTMMDAFQSGAVGFSLEERLRHKDGHYIWVDIVNNIRHDPVSRIPIEMIGVVRDITERKQAENELRESEERFRLMADNITDVMTRLSPDLVPTYESPSLVNVLGYQPEELTEKPVSDFTHPDDIDRVFAQVMKAIESKDTNSVVFRHRHKDGHYVWLESTFRSLFDDETGEPTEIVASSRDVTDRVEAEQQLRTLSQRLQLATEAGDIGIWDWDVPSDALIWDEQMFSLHGVDPSQYSADLWRTGLLHPDDQARMQSEIAAMLDGEKPLDTEFRVIHPDGELRYLKGRAMVFRDAAGKLVRVVGVNWDITLLKQAEDSLRLALETEKELGTLKSRFVSTASHEFRTPLAAILATTETLTHYRQRMDDAQIDARLGKIRQQVNYMKDIMEDVLQLARIQAGRIQFSPVSGDLDVLCEEIIGELQTQPKYRERLVYRCVDPPVITNIDLRLMRQVISNLLTNALKYSPPDKPVQIELSHDSTCIRCQVSDEGIGIPPEDQKRLFEPFHRATNVGAISGTGLGLSITKEAVLAHNGAIEVESELGKGTTFTVILPITDGEKGNTDDKNTGH